MPLQNIAQIGQFGVIRDTSAHEIPINAWTDALNIRFLEGMAFQAPNHTEVYAGATVQPEHTFPVQINGLPHWIYLSASGMFVVKSQFGSVVHTNLTPVTAFSGSPGLWTSTLLSGLPIVNTGNVTAGPFAWDLNLANKFVPLANFPANTTCKAIRAFKNVLIALNVTKAGVSLPYLVKWSHPADPGSLPPSWDEKDATSRAGEIDLAEGYDIVIDALQLRDSMIIYKEDSTWAMTFTGGQSTFSFRLLFGHGILGNNCAAEHNGTHFVVTRSDIIIHDGNTSRSVVDKQVRRFFFSDFDPELIERVFVVKNQVKNEFVVCYPQAGQSSCNKALVYNYVDNTVSFRSLPGVHHADYGRINTSVSNTWDSQTGTWDSQTAFWDKGNFVPVTQHVVMATLGNKLMRFDGDTGQSAGYIERTGMSFGSPERIKLVREVRPRVSGTAGDVLKIRIGFSNDPYATPTYTDMSHTIGSTVANYCYVAGRYIAVRFESTAANEWRLDSYDLDISQAGMW